MAKVSIVMPAYNRARFLPQAVASVRAQTFPDWELFVIDDGSTDDTPAVLESLKAGVPQPIHLIRQENQGPPAARTNGINLALASGAPYVAFLDSDDAWLPHHLRDGVEALDAHADVDLVVAPLRRVEYGTGRVVEENTFLPNGRPHPMLRLKHRQAGRLHILDDPRLFATVLEYGGVGVFQNTLYRARVFEQVKLKPYRVCEDRYMGFEVVARGFRPAYYTDVHVQYNVHGGHISAPTGGAGHVDKQAANLREIIRCYEDARRNFPMSRAERRALGRRLSHEYFWHLGYNLLWQDGRDREALTAFRHGLANWPWNALYWRTYLLAWVRSFFRPHRAPIQTAG